MALSMGNSGPRKPACAAWRLAQLANSCWPGIWQDQSWRGMGAHDRRKQFRGAHCFGVFLFDRGKIGHG